MCLGDVWELHPCGTLCWGKILPAVNHCIPVDVRSLVDAWNMTFS